MRANNKNLTSCLLATILSIFTFISHADIPPGYSVLETITYEYDAEGNRIVRGATVSSVAETPIEAQYDQGNRLTLLTLKGQGQNGTDLSCTLSYDLNGNLTGKTCTDPANATPITTQYTWDSRNRLTVIQSPGFTASFQYDPLGRRIERTVNGVTTHYLYDGNQAIAEKVGLISMPMFVEIQSHGLILKDCLTDSLRPGMWRRSLVDLRQVARHAKKINAKTL